MTEINVERRQVKTLKFAPVKVLVIESRGEYYRTVGFAFGVGLTHLFIGATTMVTFMYSLNTGNEHAGLCTLGYQLFSAEAILGLSYVNGWSAHLRLKHRVCAHIVLQICGITCAVSGVVRNISLDGVSSSGHGLTGHVALFLTLISIVTGPLGTHKYLNLKFIHMACGLSTFTMSSICLCLGFYKSQFEQWAGNKIMYVLTIFVVTYTICICTIIIVHGVLNMK